MGARLVAATPALETVEVTRRTYSYEGPPRPVFAAFEHPHVTRFQE
jgi:hypothetical protein